MLPIIFTDKAQHYLYKKKKQDLVQTQMREVKRTLQKANKELEDAKATLAHQ